MRFESRNHTSIQCQVRRVKQGVSALLKASCRTAGAWREAFWCDALSSDREDYVLWSRPTSLTCWCTCWHTHWLIVCVCVSVACVCVCVVCACMRTRVRAEIFFFFPFFFIKTQWLEAITWVIPDLNGEIIEWKKGGQRSWLVGKVRGGGCNREGKKKAMRKRRRSSGKE